MADEALKKNPAVDYSKMTGRPVPSEQNLEASVLEEVVGPMEGQIDLEINDYHPNKPRPAPGYVMQDPKKNPRFPKEKSSDLPIDPNAPLRPLPNYDYFYSKEPTFVNMEKMKGRVDDDSNLEDAVLREVEGEHFDMVGAQQVAADRDKAVTLGEKALSGFKQAPRALDMGKQVGRLDNEVQDPDELIAAMDNARAARFVDNPELTAPILRNPKDIRKENGSGARDWSKLPGRASLERDEDQIIESVGADCPQKEELILNPVVDGTSK